MSNFHAKVGEFRGEIEFQKGGLRVFSKKRQKQLHGCGTILMTVLWKSYG